VGIWQIEGKIDHLNHLFDSLNKTWQQRKILYDQSLDLEVGNKTTDFNRTRDSSTLRKVL